MAHQKIQVRGYTPRTFFLALFPGSTRLYTKDGSTPKNGGKPLQRTVFCHIFEQLKLVVKRVQSPADQLLLLGMHPLRYTSANECSAIDKMVPFR